MNAQDNAAAVQRMYAAFGSGDIPTLLEHLDDDVAWEAWTVDHRGQTAGVPWQAERRGKQGAAEFFELVGGLLEVHDFQVLDIVAGERQAAAEVVIEFTNRQTGARLRDEELHLWTFGDDGKVTRVRHYTDTAKHAAAAGVAVPA